MAESQCTKSIAAILGISPKTAEYHKAKLYTKLGVAFNDVAGVTRFAIRAGLISI